VKEKDPKPVTAQQPAATQPLQVVLAQAGEDARFYALDLGLRPSVTGKEQTSERRATTTPAAHTRSSLEDEVRHLRKLLHRCKEDLIQLMRRVNRLERAEDGGHH